MVRPLAALLSALALLLCSFPLAGACAEDVEITPSVPYRKQTYPPAGFEVAGVRLGMTGDEVKRRAAQADVKGSPVIETGTVGLSQDGLVVQARPYLQRISMDIADGTSSLRVAFSSPSIGGRAVALDYARTYFDAKTAPTLVEVFGQFEERYGAGIVNRLTPPREMVTTETWILDAEKTARCAGGYCAAYEALSLGDMDRLRTSTSLGERVIVSVIVIAQKEFPARARRVSVMIEDLTNELLDLTEVQKQLEAARASRSVPKLIEPR